MKVILEYATSPGVLLVFLHDNGTDDDHDGENDNDDDYGDVNGGHNLVHDDNNHNGKNPTLAGGRPPSAWQIIVMFVFSNTWESKNTIGDGGST